MGILDEFDAAFASLAERRINALATQSDSLFGSGHERLVALAARYAIPMILHVAELTKFGGLMSYNATGVSREAGRYAGRILKGEKPADIPCAAPDEIRIRHRLQNRQRARRNQSAHAVRAG